jgi:hypothetical protein
MVNVKKNWKENVLTVYECAAHNHRDTLLG